MKKHPSAFKLQGNLVEKNNGVKDEPVVLYDGENTFLFFAVMITGEL